MYGKLVYSTKLPSAHLTLDPKLVKIDSERLPNIDETVLVIDQTDKNISLLRMELADQVPNILVLRQENVNDLHLEVPQDVITQSIKNCRWYPKVDPVVK
jgi:hypothetical protein